MAGWRRKNNTMVEMSRARKPDFLGAEFNEFLFAPICVDARGTSLTVVSALARLDLDPWAEAAKLTRLPGGIATQNLAKIISQCPEIPSARIDTPVIAARLISLLPGRIRSNIATPQIPAPNLPHAAHVLLAPRFVFLLLFITMAVLFGTKFVMAQFHSAKIQSDSQVAAATSEIVPTPPPGRVDFGKTGN
jgi:hypothetical protein